MHIHPALSESDALLKRAAWVAVIVALVVRLVDLFWTNATIDDAYITMRVARNLATGAGMVFNPGEHVQASSSPLWLLIMAACWGLWGEGALLAGRLIGALGDSLVPLALGSLIGGAGLLPESAKNAGASRQVLNMAAIGAGLIYAVFPTSASITARGLETGMYTALIAFAFAALGRNRYHWATTFGALAAFTRPDGALVLGVVLAGIWIADKRMPWRDILLAVAILMPYLLFAFVYFGTPIPQTVIAKAVLQRSAAEQWEEFLKRFFFGVPQLVFGLMALAGWIQSWRSRVQTRPLLIWAALYVASFSTLASWWPWYLPPFVIVYCLGLGFAVVLLARCVNAVCSLLPVRVAAALGVVCVCAPLVFRLGENMQQARMDERVAGTLLRNVARQLQERMQPGEVAMIEPLGMVAFYSHRRFYDYPGLAAPAVTAAIKRLGRRIPGKPWDPAIMEFVLREVHPDWLILRYDEYLALDRAGTLRTYELVSIVPLPQKDSGPAGPIQPMYILRRQSV